jgi:hypothetical protein
MMIVEATTGFDVVAACVMPRDLRADYVTSDGHVIALMPEGSRNRFVWDGEPGEPFDCLFELRDKSAAVFTSPDGSHVAYLAGRGEWSFVGRDGHEDPPFEAITRSVPPVFSHDGARLAYGAGGASGDDFRLWLDGRPVSEVPIAPIQAVFSPDGARLAYVEQRPTADKDFEVRVVVDGQPTDWFAGMRNETGVMQFSPDGLRFAYREHDLDLNVRWIVDGVPQQWTDDPVTVRQALKRVSVRASIVEGQVSATFSPDGRRFAYFADVKGKGVAIIEDDVAGPVVKGVYGPVFSPDSRHLGYLAQQFDGRVTLVMDGVPGPALPGKDGGGPWFSADSRHAAVILRRDEGGLFHRRTVNTLFVDGRAVAELEGDDVSAAPAFSPDGEHVAWWIRRGKTCRAMVDDHPIAFDGGVESDVVYTASGRAAFVGRMPDTWCTVVCDGRPGPLAADILAPRDMLRRFGRDLPTVPGVPFAVSPDGEHLAWLGLFEEGVRPVLDDRVGPAFEAPLGVSFDDAGNATWMLQRADVVYRVSAPS